MASSNVRETEKRFVSQSKLEMSLHCFIPLSSCSLAFLLCSFSALLENMAQIFNSELRELLLP